MNIVTATFSAGCTQIDADRKLWQYDQGQVLQLVGLDLPDAYQVEFSNTRDKGSAKAQIGGPDGVQIPDEYLTTGKPVYAFLVGHTAEEDRETEKLVVIYVNARSQPTDEPITPEQQTIVDQLIAALTAGVAKAEDAAAQAEAAISYMPKIVDGTWWVYDAEAETWTDTGIQAEGQDGVGISGAVLNADYTLTLTFTDGSSYTTPPIRGAQGERGPIGPTPDISIGTVTTGAAGSQAEATMTGTPEQPVLNLTIPRGDPGEVTQAEFDDLADEVSQQKSAIEALEDLTNRKAGMLVDTASGSIASFVPDSTIPALLGVSVDIEPVQDLHGYDSPWPAGGGKNKLPPGNAGTVSNNGMTCVSDGNGSYTLSGTATADSIIKCTLPVPYTIVSGDYLHIMNPTANSGVGMVLNFADASSAYPTFSSASRIFELASRVGQTITAIGFTVINGTAYSGTITPMVVNSATPTTYSPYSNECPISGWDAVEVDGAGENIFDDAALVDLGGVKQNDGSVYFAYGSLILQKTIWSNPSGYAGQLAITLKRKSTGAYSTGRLVVRYTDGTTANIGTGTDVANEFNTYTLITPSTKSVESITGTYGTNREFYWYVQIETGSTLHDYHPYSGNRYTIQLGQTVYGGTLDVDAGTLTVDRYYVTLANSARVSYHPEESTPSIWMRYESGKLAKVTGGRAMSNIYRIGGGVAPFIAYYGTEIDIYDARFTDEQTALSLLADFKCVYTLATPIVITLDPVTISTISGQTNNVWADAGDVSVTYAADVKTYIDNKIAAAVAALS